MLPSSQDGDGQALNPTRTLIERARAGDQRAFDQLFLRYEMPLMRWAHGRLCASARGQNETRDVVLNCFSKAFNSLDRFVYRHQGSFVGYLHEILKNDVASMNRRWMTKKPSAELDGDYPDSALRPDEEYEGKERKERFERALAALTPREQELIVMREMGLTHAEIAVELELPTANAARMAVTRAIERLAAAVREIA